MTGEPNIRAFTGCFTLCEKDVQTEASTGAQRWCTDVQHLSCNCSACLAVQVYDEFFTGLESGGELLLFWCGAHGCLLQLCNYLLTGGFKTTSSVMGRRRQGLSST
jgi:hypothetical protein